MLPQSASVYSSAEGLTTSPRDERAQDVQAGYASLMLEGEPVSDSFYQVLDENRQHGYSPTVEGLNEELHREDQAKLLEDLPAILQDENLGDDYKRLATRALTEDNYEAPLTEQYSRELLSTSEEPTADTRTAKEMMTKSVKNINDYRMAQQDVIDQSNLSKDQSLAADMYDFVHMMVPFNEQLAQTVSVNDLGGDVSDIAKAFILTGESKQDMRDALLAMPLDKRVDAMKLFSKIVESGSSLGYMTNRLSGKAKLNDLIYGGYSDANRWVDDAVSLLDMSIIGRPLITLGETLGSARAASRARRTTSGVAPASPYRIAQEFSPSESRIQMQRLLADNTEETALAYSGASKEDVVADSVLPQVQLEGEGISNRTSDIMREHDKATIKNSDLKEMIDDSVVGALTQKELEAGTAAAVERLQGIKGVTPRREMFQVQQKETGATIRGVYGPDDGSWTRAQDAMGLTEIALRTEGVPKEAITLLQRDRRGDWAEVVGDMPTEPGEFLTSINYDYEINFSDIAGNWEQLGTARNFLNRQALMAKLNINRHLFDPASILDPHIVLGANVAVDKAARVSKIMLAEARNFSDLFSGLNNETQGVVLQYIKEANERGIKFTESSLREGWGFGDKEVEAIRSFRNYWDDVWALRNKVDARQLKNDGYYMIEDYVNDTRITGKPQEKGRVDTRKTMYNADTDQFTRMSQEQLEAHYEHGGGIMKLRRPMSRDGSSAEYVVHSSSLPSRRVAETDIVYPYRDGYYQVIYDAPHFITKKLANGDTKAIATAQTIEDANLYIERLKREFPQDEFGYRGNVKDPSERAGFEMDVFETYGKTNLRVRGKKLTDATAVVHNTEQSNIKGPVDTMIDVARSMGSKVSMSSYLNATKQRFMEQFADILERKNGRPVFPAQISDIGNNSQALSKDVAAARATYEYIAYLEHGLINSLDELSKGMLRTAAEVVGEAGYGGFEKVLRAASKVGPTEVAKTSAFHLYIALNPIRQALLNGHQSMLLFANFGKYAANPMGLTADLTVFADMALSGGKNLKLLAKASKFSETELKFMYREFEKSGLADAIDVHNMVRGSLAEFAETRKAHSNKTSRAVSGVYGVVRKVGFDSGEWVNVVTAWLAHYDEAVAINPALNRTDLHAIAGKARNYTMNMSRAGDMPYNQQAMAAVFQFFQVPHKALLQMSTNRILTPAQRTRLGVYSALAYSLPTSAMLGILGPYLPDPDKHPEVHEMVVQGLEFYFFNAAIKGLTGLDSAIDFSSLAPADAYGVYELIHGILGTNIGEILASSPSGQLFFGDNPRVTNFAKTVARFLNLSEDYKDDPTTLSRVFTDLASMSSGYSNLMKAKMALQYHKQFNSRGAVTDPKVSTPEAVALAFGFRSMDAARETATNAKIYNTKDRIKKDADKFYNDYTHRLSRDGITAEEIDYQVRVMQQAAHVLKDSPGGIDRVMYRLGADAERGVGTIYDAAIKLSGELPPNELKDIFMNVPDDGTGRKQMLMRYVDDLEKLGTQ